MDIKKYLDDKVTVKTGDITEEKVDVIVNAANSSLMGGGGVDGAIHRAGGPVILKECKKIRSTPKYKDGLPTGEAVVTSSGNLKAKAVIHTVGPVYKGKQSDKEKLYNAYHNSLILAGKNNFKSIAFPAISTGVYGYPKKEAAEISSKAIMDYLKNNDKIKEIRLVFFSSGDMEIFIRNNSFN